MSIEGLLIGLAMLAAAVAYTAYPLLQRSRYTANTQIEHQRDRLLVFYEQVLSTIRDLDEDLSTGKINQADYEVEREHWAQRGVMVLEAMDELNAGHPRPTKRSAEMEDAIEAAVAEYRSRKAAT